MPVPSHQDLLGIYYYPFLSMTFNLLTLKRSEYSGCSGNNKYLWTLYTSTLILFFYLLIKYAPVHVLEDPPFILPGKDILNLTTENIYSLSTKESSWLCNDFHLKYEVTKYTCIGQKKPRKTHKIVNKFTINLNDFTRYEQLAHW